MERQGHCGASICEGRTIWPCFEDFCNLHKWFPGLDTCNQVEGQLGQPGLVRYCTSSQPLFPGDDEKMITTNWGKEKLLMFDPNQRCLSYEMLDNTVGFKSYVATIKVLPVNGDGRINGCKIEWSFVADLIEGRTLEDLASPVDYCLQFMANKMEHVFNRGHDQFDHVIPLSQTIVDGCDM